MPHILPCPAPRVAFADGEISEDGRKRRRRRRRPQQSSPSDQPEEDGEGDPATLPNEQTKPEKNAHECPVPKPRGLVGEMLGFGKEVKEAPRPRVLVETRKEERRQQDGD